MPAEGGLYHVAGGADSELKDHIACVNRQGSAFDSAHFQGRCTTPCQFPRNLVKGLAGVQ